MRHTRLAPLALAAITLLAAACAPTATTGAGERVGAAALDAPCASDPPPTVAIVDFANTTAAHGTTIVGVEEAATARLITLMKASGCYVVVERSELVRIMEQQGLESMDPVELARAAGAGYVVTGTVTRGTIARPGASILGVTLGETRADGEVDVRATDIITGEVVVSMTGAGGAFTSSAPGQVRPGRGAATPQSAASRSTMPEASTLTATSRPRSSMSKRGLWCGCAVSSPERVPTKK